MTIAENFEILGLENRLDYRRALGEAISYIIDENQQIIELIFSDNSTLKKSENGWVVK